MAVELMQTNVQGELSVRENYRVGSVVSRDGTTIGYRQLGQGPGLVILHGAMESAASHMQLAEAMADAFTVYLPDRRGRGMSGPFNKNYIKEQDVQDLDAVLTKTGAHNVFGVSAGGIITLEAALVLPTVTRAAIFEPPLSINGAPSMEFLKRYDAEMAQGNVTAAMVTAMLGAEMGPAFFQKMPRGLLETLTGWMMSNQDKKAKPGDVTMRALAPTVHYDFALVDQVKDQQNRYRDVRAQVLLLGGSASPKYLQTAVQTLAELLPSAKRVEFRGLGHGATGNSDMGGKPQVVAQALRQFFGA